MMKSFAPPCADHRLLEEGGGMTDWDSSRHAGSRSGIQKKEKAKTLDSRFRGNDVFGGRTPPFVMPAPDPASRRLEDKTKKKLWIPDYKRRG